MIGQITSGLFGGHDDSKKVKGTVVMMNKNVLDFTDLASSLTGKIFDVLGQKVSFQLISSVQGDPTNGLQGKHSNPAYLENSLFTLTPLTAGSETAFGVTFDWNEEFGVPGAFIIKNMHITEFFLKSLTLEDVPNHGKVHFVCNSWVYPSLNYKSDRIFFANQPYLPSETPELLRKYRENELLTLRGDGTGKREAWDRIYDYDIYHGLGNPDQDPKSESRIPFILSLDIYVPRDERFGHLKMSDFLTYALKSIVQFILPELHALFDALTDAIPLEMIRELLRTDGEGILRFPTPLVIKDSKTAWRTDEEFAREMLAGVNPIIISRLQNTEDKLDGLTVDEAMNNNKLFILNHHDVLIPYLRRINTTTTKTYASRTLLFLQDNGSLKPLAIELSLPHPDGDQFGVTSKVYTPSDQGVESSIWQLAKAYVAVNDTGVHQLISHWLNTHAVIEPFVIATNRQLSVLHPIHKLLYPHFRDTMNINAMARQILINAGGVLESTVFPSKFAMEMSAVVYKDWVFPNQALPADLVKRHYTIRGVAVEDSSSPHGVQFLPPPLRLLIEDYPYAVDGLEIWSAIKSWVTDYCSFYYGSDEEILKDNELQGWWKELREVGHGDKKNEPWWPEMETPQELIDSCTTIIWIASALHAAVNFGQYPYAGYLPNRPTVSRRFMPEPGTPEYEELKKNPDKAFLKTITAQLQTLLGVSLIEILSRHTTDEIYLRQRESPEWTKDKEPLAAFDKFGKKLTDIEKQIIQRNGDNILTNRSGPVNAPYTLLFPTSEGGLTGKGIPNSVSI
ncbi:hypothetical protein KY290_035173 [Solanum tuberosum]|uniref:Lipoxygenase n=1 Tax=Solanum tuberosum TaxID=4113 RepID=A0ABQ7U8W6_SOLTU|nr:hypothetical protein KY285_034467 [Solanum tuberosum]KAH0742130.1 hypothetical protein KY290_035173 [Solanum tuberosum]